jgi:hypothetical protein
MYVKTVFLTKARICGAFVTKRMAKDIVNVEQQNVLNLDPDPEIILVSLFLYITERS